MNLKNIGEVLDTQSTHDARYSVNILGRINRKALEVEIYESFYVVVESCIEQKIN